MVTPNKELIDRIKADADKYDSTTVFLGTARQSYVSDNWNLLQNRNGSCFENIVKFCKVLGEVQFDNLLLADVYGELAPGISYARAMDNIANPTKEVTHKDWMRDNRKLTILYAQMQKIASECPYDEITFEFYDDKYLILSDLYNLLKDNTHLIPSNVTLRLNIYNERKLYTPDPKNWVEDDIRGTGIIDRDYAQTIRNNWTEEDKKSQDFKKCKKVYQKLTNYSQQLNKQKGLDSQSPSSSSSSGVNSKIKQNQDEAALTNFGQKGPDSLITQDYSSNSDSENHQTPHHDLANLKPRDTPENTATDKLKKVLKGYWNLRETNNNQFEHGFFGWVFGKSRDQKKDAIKALKDALDRSGEISPEHLSTLRDGKLGQAIRTFLRENNSADILDNNKQVYTIRDFVHALNEQQTKLVLES